MERGILILVMRGWVVGLGEDRNIEIIRWRCSINEDAERKSGEWSCCLCFLYSLCGFTSSGGMIRTDWWEFIRSESYSGPHLDQEGASLEVVGGGGVR